MTDGRTDGWTNGRTDAGNNNTRRPKLASGENGKLKFRTPDHGWVWAVSLSRAVQSRDIYLCACVCVSVVCVCGQSLYQESGIRSALSDIMLVTETT